MTQLSKSNRIDQKDLEYEVAQVSIEDGTNQQVIIKGGTNSAMTDVVGTTVEDGYINCSVDIAGTLTDIKVPFWLDD